MSAKEINKLSSFEKRLEQKEAKLSPEERLNEKEKSLAKRSPEKQNEDRKADSKRLGGNIEELTKEKRKNDVELDKAKDGVNASQTKLSNFNRDMSPKHKEMDRLNKKIESGFATNDNVKKFAKLKSEDNANVGTGQDFKSKMQERGNLEKDLSEKTNVKNNLEIKGKNIDKAIERDQKEKEKVDNKIPEDPAAPAVADPAAPAPAVGPAGGSAPAPAVDPAGGAAPAGVAAVDPTGGGAPAGGAAPAVDPTGGGAPAGGAAPAVDPAVGSAPAGGPPAR